MKFFLPPPNTWKNFMQGLTVSKKKTQKTDLYFPKRRDIIVCPYFQMKYLEYKKNSFAFDMYCLLDDMIFASYKFSGKPKKRDIKTMQQQMRSNCSLDCPKIWKQRDTGNYEDYLYERFMADEGAFIPEYDDDLNSWNPPF